MTFTLISDLFVGDLIILNDDYTTFYEGHDANLKRGDILVVLEIDDVVVRRSALVKVLGSGKIGSIFLDDRDDCFEKLNAG